MMVPSVACQTCKIRRIKCDGIKPVCQRCTKSRRTCLDAEAVKQACFSIHLENAYASGKTKRPRGPRSNLTVLNSSFNLQNRALSYYLQCHLQELSEVPRNSRGLAECVSAWKVSGRKCSMVDLALSSMALAIFARAQRHAPAAIAASKSYCNVLNIAQKRIARLAESALDECDIDSCLLAASLMSRYELAADHPGAYDSLIQSCSHHGGAMAILKVWNDKLHDKTPTFIIKQTRKELIKSAIIRNRKIPEWCLDGSRFGEREDDLAYDHIVARLAKLQYEFNSLQNGYPQLEVVEKLDAEAQNLDDLLQKWSSYVPTTCSPKEHAIADAELQLLPKSHFYSRTVFSYPKSGNAAAWCQYYAVRMLINSTRLALLEIRCGLLDIVPCGYEKQKLDYITKIQVMGDSIAASIPFCLEKVKIRPSSTTSQPSITITTDNDAKPHSASLLVWPVTIASRIPEIDQVQQLWLRSELAAFGRILGDGMLEKAETGQLAIL